MCLAFLLQKIYITAMRLIIFLTIHLIIMTKSTISYIKTLPIVDNILRYL